MLKANRSITLCEFHEGDVSNLLDMNIWDFTGETSSNFILPL